MAKRMRDGAAVEGKRCGMKWLQKKKEKKEKGEKREKKKGMHLRVDYHRLPFSFNPKTRSAFSRADRQLRCRTFSRSANGARKTPIRPNRKGHDRAKKFQPHGIRVSAGCQVA